MLDPRECPCRPDLEAFWDGDLEGQEYEAVCRHLAACALCAAEQQLQEAVGALLRECDPAEPLAERAAQRLRTDLLARAAASLVEEAARTPVTPRRPWGPVRSFCFWIPALTAVLLIARWAPAWLAPAPPPVGSRVGSAPPSVHAPTVHPPTLPPTAPEPPRVALDERSRPGRDRRLRAPELPSRPVAEQRRPPAVRMVQAVPAAKPTSTTTAPRPPAAPLPERLVIDLSGPLRPSQPPSTLTLVASGSPDTPGGEAVIIRTDAIEEIP